MISSRSKRENGARITPRNRRTARRLVAVVTVRTTVRTAIVGNNNVPPRRQCKSHNGSGSGPYITVLHACSRRNEIWRNSSYCEIHGGGL